MSTPLSILLLKAKILRGLFILSHHFPSGQAQVVGLQPYVFAFADNGNITAKTDAGGKYIYHPTKINAVQYIKDYTSAIPPLQQDIIYTPFLRPFKITEGVNELESRSFF